MRRMPVKFLCVLMFHLLGSGSARPSPMVPQAERSVWTLVSNDTAQQARGARAFTIGNRAYVGTGQRTQALYLSDFREFNPDTGAWTAKASFAGGPVAYACAFGLGGKGYLGLGHNGFSAQNGFWEYDPASDSWRGRAAFPGASRVRALGLAADGKGYVMMGIGTSNTLFNDLWAYDPAADTWTQKTSCPGNGRSGPVGFAVGAKIYVGLGEGETAIDPTFWEYDTQTDTWAQKQPFPGDLRWGAAATALGGKGYVGTGGGTGDEHLTDIWEYDATADRWARKASLPAPGRAGAAAFALGEELYFGLGEDAASQSLGDTWKTCPDGFFGQAPPGTTPRAIAKTFLGTAEATIFAGSMSPGGTEYLYTQAVGNSRVIMGTRLVNGDWTTPAPMPFSAGYGAIEPHITFDDGTVYWLWMNPERIGIYAADRTAEGWSSARYVGPGMFVSSSRDGEIYVTDLAEPYAYLAQAFLADGMFDRITHLAGGMEALRTVYPNQTHPGVAPDGSYLLFDVGGGSHLFVCFRNDTGRWGPAIDLTRHGIDPACGIASVSPDGRYAFFGIIPGDYYWVSTELITRLGPGDHPLGDVNADNRLDSRDLLLLQLVLAGRVEADRPPAGNVTGADWNGNGQLEAGDLAGLAAQLCGP